VFLIPTASPPVKLFINVPDEELDERYPHVPSVEALCGAHFIALGELRLFGAPLELAGDCARDDRNTHLAPLLTKLALHDSDLFLDLLKWSIVIYLWPIY
jgi:hypothetical protein